MLVSLMAVYQYTDGDVLSDLLIPEGMNWNLARDTILKETAELNLVYSDPEILKKFIADFCKRRLDVWTHLWNLSQEEYDPLINYDRRTQETTQHGHKETTDFKHNNEATTNNNTRVFGFDSETAVGKDGESGNIEGENKGQDIRQHSGVDIVTTTNKGNIGVTTYQQMMREEFDIRPKLDIYKFIAVEFAHEFCIMVY